MAILSKGTDFTTGDQVTAAKLDALVDSATFAAGAVDDSTTALDSSTPKKIIVKNGGISSTQLATDAVTTVKVENNAITLAKMATQADQTVLGNVSGGAAVPTAIPIVDNAGILINSDSLGTSDTKGATQGNIKVYADAAPKAQMKADNVLGASVANDTESITLPNGLIMKFGENSGADGTVTYGVAFPNAVISICLTPRDSAARGAMATITASSVSAFTIDTSSSNDSVYWQAIGR